MDTYSRQIRRAAGDISRLRQSGKGPDGSQVLFPHLPYLLKEEVLISEEEKKDLLSLREEAKSYDAVISIGIGGSYLGNQVLFDLFCGPYWNQLTKEERKGYPQIYFSGQNVDPMSLTELASCLIKKAGRMANRRMKVLFLVISKFGTTIEPVTAVQGLKKLLAPVCDIHLMDITDKEKGRNPATGRKGALPLFYGARWYRRTVQRLFLGGTCLCQPCRYSHRGISEWGKNGRRSLPVRGLAGESRSSPGGFEVHRHERIRYYCRSGYALRR